MTRRNFLYGSLATTASIPILKSKTMAKPGNRCTPEQIRRDLEVGLADVEERLIKRCVPTQNYDSTDAGKMAQYLMRWRMRDGSTGPWSETISATITG